MNENSIKGVNWSRIEFSSGTAVRVLGFLEILIPGSILCLMIIGK
ncbi:MAG TPA: hypothetical protein VG895_05035 [Patescibacteria group bacterium]|nr:hypothetical protein [Patescibacteria group bacterium]